MIERGDEVVHAGVSGDTSAGGLRRLDWSLEGDVKILVLELGANEYVVKPFIPEELVARLTRLVDASR